MAIIDYVTAVRRQITYVVGETLVRRVLDGVISSVIVLRFP